MKEFRNVPEWLIERVLALSSTTDLSNRYQVRANVSGWVISWYLRKDVANPDEDSFFDHPGQNDSAVRWGDHANRVVGIAETLFLLRNTPGFEEFQRRLTSRPLRSTYFETRAAKRLFLKGFDIFANPEIGARGQDYDFYAKKDHLRINVEVTALTAECFSANTVRNALTQKRTQLPTDSPAIIYCAMPEKWFPTPQTWNEHLPQIANDFLRGTRRVNAIVFWTEKHFSFSDSGAALILMSSPHLNSNPRHSISDRSIFVGLRTAEEGVLGIQGETARALMEDQANNNEFFQWIDDILPVPHA